MEASMTVRNKHKLGEDKVCDMDAEASLKCARCTCWRTNLRGRSPLAHTPNPETLCSDLHSRPDSLLFLFHSTIRNLLEWTFLDGLVVGLQLSPHRCVAHPLPLCCVAYLVQLSLPRENVIIPRPSIRWLSFKTCMRKALQHNRSMGACLLVYERTMCIKQHKTCRTTNFMPIRMMEKWCILLLFQYNKLFKNIKRWRSALRHDLHDLCRFLPAASMK